MPEIKGERPHPRTQSLPVVVGDQESGLAVFNQLRVPAHIGGHNRRTDGEHFE